MSRYFGQPAHNALVVPDLDEGIAALAAAGAGPFYVMREIRGNGRYRGARSRPFLSAAFVSTGTMQYEVIAPLDAEPSAYTEFLARHPSGGLHHVAYWADDIEAALAGAAAAGQRFRIVQEFLGDDGMPFEIYVEPEGKEGSLLIQLMKHGPFDDFFVKVEEAAASWDGTALVRDAFDILAPELRALQVA